MSLATFSRLFTIPLCPFIFFTCSPVSASQALTVWSTEQDTIWLPSYVHDKSW